MELRTYIKSFASIEAGVATENGKQVADLSSDEDFNEFALALYRQLDLKYSKFHKMDELSKLGFLTSEMLLNSIEEEHRPDENTAIVVANSESSLYTDRKYFATTQGEDAYPSPSLFVYTLPNIVVGEIAIRNKFKGENAFFVFDKIEYDFISEYVNLLLENAMADACICGWIDMSEERYRSFLCLIEKTPLLAHDNHLSFNPENLKLIFGNG